MPPLASSGEGGATDLLAEGEVVTKQRLSISMFSVSLQDAMTKQTPIPVHGLSAFEGGL